MDLNKIRSVHADICVGCLSSNRVLSPLIEYESKVLFNEFIGKTGLIESLLICWECTALVRKALKFKKQVRYSASLLNSYLLNPDTKKLTTISNLKISDTECITHDTHMVQRKEKTSSDLGFIKTENQDADVDDDDDFEGFFVDSLLVDDLTTVDDKDFQAVLKEETQEFDSKQIVKKNKTKEEFHDSDDEPLKPSTKVEIKEECKENETRKKKKKKRKEGKLQQQIEEENCANKTVSTTKARRGRERAPGVVTDKRVSRKLEELNVDPGKIEVVVLSWEEVELERQKALQNVVFTRHGYKCFDCVLGFNHKFKLDNHMKKHDDIAGSQMCDVCKIRCKDFSALSAHKRRHRVRWRCTVCGEASSRAAVAADHYARTHGHFAPTHTCSVCGHVASSLGKLRHHLKNHGERQKCDLCAKTFRDRTSLRTHLFIHRGEKEYGCPRCDKRFLFKRAMETHLITHETSAALYCYQCDMNFKNKMSYYQHMKYNLKHVDPAKLKYACQLCDKKFLKAARLEEHNFAVHLKITPIKCSMAGCNFACSSRPVLRTHVRMSHRNLRHVRNHVCDTCGKAYTTKKTLEGHMRTHTGERPFKCSHCPSTFGYEAALYNHNKLVHLKPKQSRLNKTTPALVPGSGPSWRPLADNGQERVAILHNSLS